MSIKDMMWMIAYKEKSERKSAEELYGELLKQIWVVAKCGQMNLVAIIGPAVEEMLIEDGFDVIRYEKNYDEPCVVRWG